MQRALILGATSLVVMGLAVPGYLGMTDRLERLEQKGQALRTREQGLREDLGTLRARLAEAEQARRAASAREALVRGELEGLERRLAVATVHVAQHVGLLEDLSETGRSARAVTEARLAALESGVDSRWDGLRRAVDAASTLASETRHELEGLVEPSERDRWTTMVGPSVKLAGDATVGSGVLLPSRELEGDAGYETLALTAWHVVRDIRADSLQMDPAIPVTIYREDGTLRHEEAVLVAHEPALDVAVLHLATSEPVAHGARLATRREMREARIFRRIVAVGCPLGNDPVPTRGEISDTDHAIDGSVYWMISAPTYIGNSGGGIFDARSHRLMGIFSKIYTHGSLRPTVVPHMGLATPLDRVYSWLEARDEVELSEGPDGVELRLAPETGGE